MFQFAFFILLFHLRTSEQSGTVTLPKFCLESSITIAYHPIKEFFISVLPVD